MSVIRRILIVLCTLIYLIGCPLTILYAFGYLLRPGEVHELVQTGLLSVSTHPPGASIYINRRRYTKQTPAVLQGLLPGRYDVRLVLKQYQPWTQTVSIEAGKATALEHMLLRPHWLKPVVLVQEPFEELIPIPETHLVLLAKGRRVSEHLLYDWKDQRGWPLQEAGGPSGDAQVVAHLTVPGSPAALLRLAVADGEEFWWLELKGRALHFADLTGSLGQWPAVVQWDAKERTSLVAWQQGAVRRIALETGTATTLMEEASRGIGLLDQWVYLLLADGTLRRLELEGREGEVLLADPAFGRSLFGRRGFFRIQAVSKDHLLFVGERGELLTNRLPYRLVDEGVLDISPAPARDEVLVWRRHGLGVVELSPRQRRGEVFETGPTMRWLFEEGREIGQAFWVGVGTHILFRDQDGVYLLDRERSGGTASVRQLLEIKRRSAIAYSDELGAFCYLDRASGTVQMLPLVPQRELPVPLP